MKKIFSLILVLALALTGCSSQPAATAGLLKDGTYTGTGKGNNGDVKVEVVIKSDVIESVTVAEHAETPGISDPAIDGIPAAIVDANSALVDTVAGATNTSNAIIAAVKDCIAQAGGDGETFGASEKVEVEKTAKTEEVDMVVVGAGLSGMSAALSAHENGVENIVIVEKQAAAGGTTSLAGGFFIYVNDDNYSEFHNYWLNERMSESGVEAKYYNDERFEYVVPKTASTVEWLKGQGVSFAEELSPIFGAYNSAMGTAGGAGVVADLVKACEANGIKLITNCKGTELVMDGDAVVGVVAESADEITTYTAKAVVLACGGSGSNEEITAAKSPKVAAAMTINTGAAGNTGDGLAMAVAAGAVEYEEFFSSLACQTMDPAVEGSAALPYATQLIVNAKGERFVKEDASAINDKYDATASAMIQGGNAPYWTIYSDANAEDVVAILKAGVEAGTVVSGSITEIAGAMGVDAETFDHTFVEYAAAVVAGEDKAFGKAAENLTQDWLLGETFYAVKIFPTTFGSQGGVKTDFDGRVLNAEGNAIKGLYAVGEMSNREFYNENYVLAASLGLYSTVGRLCGVAVSADIAG